MYRSSLSKSARASIGAPAHRRHEIVPSIAPWRRTVFDSPSAKSRSSWTRAPSRTIGRGVTSMGTSAHRAARSASSQSSSDQVCVAGGWAPCDNKAMTPRLKQAASHRSSVHDRRRSTRPVPTAIRQRSTVRRSRTTTSPSLRRCAGPVPSAAEAYGCLVALPVFKTGEVEHLGLAGSIPVRLRARRPGRNRR